MNGVRTDEDSVSKLRDVIWANIHRGTSRKICELRKTSLDHSGQLTELNETVLDILGQKIASAR